MNKKVKQNLRLNNHTKFFLLVFAFMFFCLLTLIAIVSSYPINKNSTINYKNTENQATFDFWLSKLKSIGGEKAYEEFKLVTEKKAIILQHKESHLFGEALYETYGIDGITVCDTKFNYGCYHSFLGSAIHFEGLEVIPKLYKKCTQNSSKSEITCPHGIGHGILTSVGYDFESLHKALKICADLELNDPVSGCFNGVFMEYNFQTMLMDEAIKRKFNTEDPYYPCFLIDKKFANSCMFQQSQWWLNVIDEPIKQRVETIDSLCARLSSSGLKERCYRGMGVQILSYINHDTERAKQICTGLSERNAEINCRAGVTIYLKVSDQLKDNRQELCNDTTLSKSEQQLCWYNTGNLDEKHTIFD
jgi:hypothetical protein